MKVTFVAGYQLRSLP